MRRRRDPLSGGRSDQAEANCRLQRRLSRRPGRDPQAIPREPQDSLPGAMGSTWYGFYILESRMSPPHLRLPRFALWKAPRIGVGRSFRNANRVTVVGRTITLQPRAVDTDSS